MDPVTALGVASAAITFFDFASKLLKVGKEIYSSPSGAAAGTLEVEQSYQQLHDLCDRIQNPQVPRGSVKGEPPSPEVVELVQLSQSCKNDCQKLLEIVRELKVQPIAGRTQVWKKLQATTRTLKWSRTISEMETRLGRAQASMSLHVSTIIR